jgi:predicted MPP superfamily phosphohydrolase
VSYPSIVARTPKGVYDLILAGHTHGGQVRMPFVGNPVLSKGDTTYARGLFHTEAGLLYENSGIGTFYWPVRFRCRPEITIIEL